MTDMGEKRNAYRILVGGNLKDRDSFQKRGIGRSILHEEIDLEGIEQEGWVTLIWLKIGARKGLLLTQHV